MNEYSWKTVIFSKGKSAQSAGYIDFTDLFRLTASQTVLPSTFHPPTGVTVHFSQVTPTGV